MNSKYEGLMRRSMESLRGQFANEDCTKILVYIVFIKYIIDNKKITLNKSNFELFLDAQRMYDIGLLDKDVVTRLNYIIEDTYVMKSGSLSEFSNLYFRILEIRDSKKINIIDILKEASFVNDNENIIEALQLIIWETAAGYGRIMSEEISTKPLSLLVKSLLDLESGENFADLAYGMGMSTITISEGIDCNITGYEISDAKASMAKMLLLIAGEERGNIICEDSTSVELEKESQDKIAILAPLGVKVQKLNEGQSELMAEFGLPIKSTSLEILLALQAIKIVNQTGKIVMNVTPKTMFSNTPMDKKFRELIAKNHLKTVITLPPLYFGINVATNILIMEKYRTDKEVLFVDCSNNNYFSFVERESRTKNQLSEKGLIKIKEIIKNKEIIEGVSYKCSLEELENNEYSLATSRYTKIIKEREYLSNKEIDKQLSELYSEIIKMIN